MGAETDTPVPAFDEFAEEYDGWFARHHAIFQSELRVLKDLVIPGLVLDVGAGTGIFAGNLGIRIGIDPSAAMLRLAMKRGVDVIQAVGEHLPFADERFDCVILVNTISFVNEPGSVLRECGRVLKGSGMLVLCDIPKSSPWGKLYELNKRRGHRFYRYANFYTVAEIVEMTQHCGMKVDSRRGSITFRPDEPERIEEPREAEESLGFVCIRARKLKRD